MKVYSVSRVHFHIGDKKYEKLCAHGCENVSDIRRAFVILRENKTILWTRKK